MAKPPVNAVSGHEHHANFLTELSASAKFDYDLAQCVDLGGVVSLACATHARSTKSMWDIAGLFSGATDERVRAAELAIHHLRRRLEVVRAAGERFAVPHMLQAVGFAFGEFTAAACESARVSLAAVRPPNTKSSQARFERSKPWRAAVARTEDAKLRLMGLAGIANANPSVGGAPTTESPSLALPPNSAVSPAVIAGTTRTPKERANLIRRNAAALMRIPGLKMSHGEAAIQAGYHVQRAIDLGAFEGGPRDGWLAPLRFRLRPPVPPSRLDPHLSAFAEAVALAQREQSSGQRTSLDVSSDAAFDTVGMVLAQEADRISLGAKRLPPLSKRSCQIYEVLDALEPHEALPLREILARVSTTISESVFHRDLKPELKRWGMRNAPKKGYYLEKE